MQDNEDNKDEAKVIIVSILVGLVFISIIVCFVGIAYEIVHLREATRDICKEVQRIEREQGIE